MLMDFSDSVKIISLTIYLIVERIVLSDANVVNHVQIIVIFPLTLNNRCKLKNESLKVETRFTIFTGR